MSSMKYMFGIKNHNAVFLFASFISYYRDFKMGIDKTELSHKKEIQYVLSFNPREIQIEGP